MRRMLLAISVIVALAAAFKLGRTQAGDQPAGKAQRRRVAYYVDPMHPAFKSSVPGIAPDCGMALVPVYADDAATPLTTAAAAQSSAESVSIDAVMRQLLGIRLAPAERSGVTRIARVAGRTVPEDTRVYRINSGVDGFIRETFHDSVGTFVKKDQTLATYYAPDFLAVASGFLAAVERVPGAVGNDGSRTMPFPGAVSKQGVSSLQGYTDRLRNLGMSDVQIRRIADTHQLPESVEVVAPADGFILARNISPGQHFEHAMEFYRIADLSKMWVVAEVPGQDASYLRSGASASIVLRDEGRRLPARLADALPQSDLGGTSVGFRLEVDNAGGVLRPGSVVDVELPIPMPSAITVPVDAVVDSGTRTRVYVESGQDVFAPRDVRVGWRSSDRVQILEGLTAGEQVVATATFLIDSESRLRAIPRARPESRPIALQERTTMRDPESAGAHHGHGDD
jgi:Cu(I)/Ag(I) efflux system membrane fusion protein